MRGLFLFLFFFSGLFLFIYFFMKTPLLYLQLSFDQHSLSLTKLPTSHRAVRNLFYLSWPALVSGPGGVSGPEPCGKLDFWVRLDVSINNFMVEHRWEWRQLLSTLSRGRYIETRHWKLQVRLHRRQNFTFWDIRNFIFVEKEESTYIIICSWIINLIL